ncbi:MAG: Glucan endo-1,3-beta-glucosidase, partial [Parcubacteria group bacterium GW2011_GWC2_44_17]
TELSHVVGTYTAGIARVYVNGSEVVSKTIGGNLSNWATNSPLTLANNVTGAYPWQGEFHLVAIYNRALTSEEVSQNFDFGPGDQMPNQPPTVAIVANPTSGAAPLTVTFTPTAQDPDGTIATYAWDFGDSSTATEQNPTHTYSTPGTYTAKVTVTDNQGATAFANVVITVSDKPSPNLTLAKSADKTEVQSADTITYTITYKNDGTADAINVVITDPIPSGTVYVDQSATQGGAYNTNKNEIQWTIPTLAPNASGSVSFLI